MMKTSNASPSVTPNGTPISSPNDVFQDEDVPTIVLSEFIASAVVTASKAAVP